MDRKKIDELVDNSVVVYGDIDEVIDYLSKLRERFKEKGYLSLELTYEINGLSLIGTRPENDKEFAKRKKEIAKYKADKIAKKGKKEKKELQQYLELKKKFEKVGE